MLKRNDISHARVGALTIHHPDWMDRHPSGSRHDTHGTLGPVRGEAVGCSAHLTGTSPTAGETAKCAGTRGEQRSAQDNLAVRTSRQKEVLEEVAVKRPLCQNTSEPR